ncbi:response regulator [bacterium]|nr:response regulator [bacterium]
MSDKINVEIDDAFIKNLFEITNTTTPPIGDINVTVLKKQLLDVKSAYNKLKEENEKLKATKPEKKTTGNTEVQKNGSAENDIDSMQQYNGIDLSEYAGNVDNVQKASDMEQLGIPMNYNQSSLQFIDPSTIKRTKKQYYDDNGHPVKGKILIIDDLGIITYQLEVILKRAGYLPVSSREIYDAVEKYKRSSFDYVIMDLFIPTEREGFILLEELKKIAAQRNEIPIIAIMSASSRKEHKKECQKKGAAFYVEKVNEWQKELFGLLLQYD